MSRRQFLRLMWLECLVCIWIVLQLLDAICNVPLPTQPVSWLDWVAWPVLRVIWEPFSYKRSHWWHWRNTARPNEWLPIVGDPLANSQTDAWSIFYNTNFAWQTWVELAPVGYQGSWQVGYTVGSTTQVCAIVLTKTCRVLIGNGDVGYFGITLQGKPVQLRQVRRSTGRAVMRQVPLL